MGSLTFDSVFLPRLDSGSFHGAMQSRMHNLLFVGVSRAIKGVFMSGTNGHLINLLIEMRKRDTHAFLETQLAQGAGDMFNTAPNTEAVPIVDDEFGLN